MSIVKEEIIKTKKEILLLGIRRSVIGIILTLIVFVIGRTLIDSVQPWATYFEQIISKSFIIMSGLNILHMFLLLIFWGTNNE